MLPSTLKSVLLHVNELKNEVNGKLIQTFYEWMKDNQKSEDYQKNNIKAIINFTFWLYMRNPAKRFSVDLQDSLSVSELVGADVLSGIKIDWAQVGAAGAGAAVGASLAAEGLLKAADTIGSAVARLQGLVSSMQNSFAWGFQQFGSGGGINSVGATRARVQMAGMAETVV